MLKNIQKRMSNPIIIDFVIIGLSSIMALFSENHEKNPERKI
jgi:hypothetical protein